MVAVEWAGLGGGLGRGGGWPPHPPDLRVRLRVDEVRDRLPEHREERGRVQHDEEPEPLGVVLGAEGAGGGRGRGGVGQYRSATLSLPSTETADLLYLARIPRTVWPSWPLLTAHTQAAAWLATLQLLPLAHSLTRLGCPSNTSNGPPSLSSTPTAPPTFCPKLGNTSRMPLP